MYKPKNKYELSKLIIKLMFKDLDSDIVDLNSIDTSNITDFSGLFSKPIFRGVNFDVSGWDTSRATDMTQMFWMCKKFNCDLSKWNVSNVTDMSGMFCECYIFNCDLSKWNVSNVTDMSLMFFECRKFNCDLSKWDLSSIKFEPNSSKQSSVHDIHIGPTEGMFRLAKKMINNIKLWPNALQKNPNKSL